MATRREIAGSSFTSEVAAPHSGLQSRENPRQTGEPPVALESREASPQQIHCRGERRIRWIP